MIDLGSSNGTLVNGELITHHPLASGDRIEIGGTLLIFTGAGTQASAKAGHGVEIIARTAADEHAALHGDASRIISSVSGAAAFGRDSQDRPESDRNLEVMYLTALAVGRTDSIPELLDRVLRLVFDWVAADRGCIMLREGDSNPLKPAARCDRDSIGGSDGARDKVPIAISRTILDYVIDRKEGVRTSDARDDSRFDAAHSIVQSGIREALCVPLQGRYAVVGALYVDTYTSPGAIIQSGYQARFTDEQLRLMTAIGYQAALAIEDAFYYSAMVQSERLAVMGQTIATLSHHIKNILQGMRGGSYLIDAGLKRNDTEAVRRGWGIVERNQERISNLVMDMLTFSKEREPERVEADLNETVNDVVELMRSRAEEMNVSLDFQPDTELPTASFDPDALHRAILNIVTNAIDAATDRPETSVVLREAVEPFERSGGPLASDSQPVSSPESNQTLLGRVLITTRFDPSDGWMISVTDDGPGINDEDREKIFSLFESKKGARGTGLGLPVSEKIMREHGGRIEIVDSRSADAPQRGTCFRLRLPPTDETSQWVDEGQDTRA